VRRQGNSSNTPALLLRLHALRTVHRPNPLRELAGVPQMSGRHNVKHCTDQRFCHGPHAPRGIGEGPHPDRHMAVFGKSYTRPPDDSFLPGEIPPFPPRNFRALSPMRMLASPRARQAPDTHSLCREASSSAPCSAVLPRLFRHRPPSPRAHGEGLDVAPAMLAFFFRAIFRHIFHAFSAA
jgi:hypothetical protein